MSQYYLVASLPTLVLGEPAPFETTEMVERCSNMLSKSELLELSLVLDGREPEAESNFCREWIQSEIQMRDAIVNVRAGKLSVEKRDYLRDHKGYSVSIDKAVTDAYAKPNPYEREFALDRFRFKLLDDLVLMDRFSFAAVLAYAVKLRLVARWAKLVDEQGRERFEELVKATGEAQAESKGTEEKP